MNPLDKFTVVYVSADGDCHLDTYEREALEKHLDEDHWGASVTIATDYHGDLQYSPAPCIFIIPGWPIEPKTVTTVTKRVLP